MHSTNPNKRKTRVGVRDFRSNLSGFLKHAHDGQIIEVTSHNEVVAELHPATDGLKAIRREPGTLRGKIWIAPDFDELPSELIDAFES